MESHWIPIQYSIAFENNGAAGSMDAMTDLKYDSEYSISANTLTRDYYEFAGWKEKNGDRTFADQETVKNLTTISGNTVTLQAQWKKKDYRITIDPAGGTFSDTTFTEGEVSGIYERTYQVGDTAFNLPTPTKTGHQFKGWKLEGTDPVMDVQIQTDAPENRAYTAVWEINKFNVIFKDDDGSVLKEVQSYDYNTPANEIVKPTIPNTKRTDEYTYTFKSWNPEITNVTADATYTATYTREKNKYSITWNDENGNTLQTDSVEYGTKAADLSKPAAPVKEATKEFSYTFTGWTPALTDVTGPATYKATYSKVKNQYKITWVDGDGKTIKQDTKEYGTVSGNFVIPDTDREPTAEYTYTFTGWDPAITDVTGDATYKATYSKVKNQYKITWVDADGNTIKEELLDYGTVLDDSIVPEAPTMESTKEYTCAFTGWEPAIAKVTGDATYKATYSQTKNQFTITWVDGDGKTLKTESVAYGETPAYGGVDPTKAETDHYTYTFNKKWSPEIVAATADATYTAQFDWTLKEGADPFLDKDNTEEDTKGTKFSILFPRIAKVTKNSVQIKWRPVEGADGYLVYGSQCNSGGVKRYFARMAETDAGTTSYTAKKLKKASYYKFYVVAYKNTADGQEALAKTKRIHVTTLNKKTGDATDLKIYRIADSKKKAMKKKLSLKEKGSVTIFATEVNKQHKRIKRHKAIGVESDQPDVVKVTDLSGKKAQKRKIKLTGLKKGTANVYIYAQNGLYKTIKVTVK
ncbi:MAG: InlB B-repeat-containing protein [Lachnospiraceae bacterium]|nr:InlB B-repeat-containing protein [Lachnospiraceae bacterium]